MKLTDEHRRLLRTIMEDSPCTKPEAARRANLTTNKASVLLHEMAEHDPPLVASEVDSKTHEEVWIVTVAGADALDVDEAA
jgi:hypothetical protein